MATQQWSQLILEKATTLRNARTREIAKLELWRLVLHVVFVFHMLIVQVQGKHARLL